MLLGLTLNPSSSDAMYEHIAGVLCNVTRLPEGRKLLLADGGSSFRGVSNMLASSSEVKKRGAASTLKNCCVSAERDGTLDAILSDKVVIAKMLVRACCPGCERCAMSASRLGIRGFCTYTLPRHCQGHDGLMQACGTMPLTVRALMGMCDV